MASSRERWSSSNRGDGRDGMNGDGWSGTLGSFGSGNALKKKIKFIAPKCNCGTFAILFMSSTLGNPNRLFYGCPYSKTFAPHFKYFAWLDEYVAGCDQEVSKPVFQGGGKQIEGKQSGSAQFDLKVRQLEDRVVGLEMQLRNNKHEKSGSGFTGISFMVFAFVLCIALGNVIRALG
ncbi:hypothetical protein PIB30_027468 [Stylosanthes scabra]|uniref:GRF-type domain-containing protein n=1 Tax=Stylosanthes scabra TaxID=79078 RepID=A0ABU6Z9E5_9FABA|nr:hypothetical protein [Stylosanthes scabra]